MRILARLTPLGGALSLMAGGRAASLFATVAFILDPCFLFDRLAIASS
jgi:hypothetical protein